MGCERFRNFVLAGLLAVLLCLGSAPAHAQEDAIKLIWIDWEPCTYLKTKLEAAPFEGYNVSVQCVPFDRLINYTITDLYSGGKAYGYDLLFLDRRDIGMVVDLGFVENVNDVINAEATRKGDFFTKMLSSLSEYPRNSRQYWSVPFSGDAHMLAYRHDLFEAAGIAPPSSIGDVVEAAKRLHGPGMSGLLARWCLTGSFECEASAIDIWRTLQFIKGGAFWNPATFDFRGHADDAAGLAALQMMADLYQTGPGNMNVSSEHIIDMCQGKGAMFLGWISEATYLAQCSFGDKLTFISIPSDRDRQQTTAFVGRASAAFVSAFSHKKTAAKKLAQWISTRDFQQQIKVNGFLTVRQSVTSSPSFLVDSSGTYRQAHSIYIQSVPNVRSGIQLPFVRYLDADSGRVLADVVTKRVSVKEGLAMMTSLAQAYVDDIFPCGPSCLQPIPDHKWEILIIGFLLSILGIHTAVAMLEDIPVVIGKGKAPWGIIIMSCLPLSVTGIWCLVLLMWTCLEFPGFVFDVAFGAAGALLSVLCAFVGCALSLLIAFRMVAVRKSGRAYVVTIRHSQDTSKSGEATPGGISQNGAHAVDFDSLSFKNKFLWCVARVRGRLLLAAAIMAVAINAVNFILFLVLRVPFDAEYHYSAMFVPLLILFGGSVLTLLCILYVQKAAYRFLSCALMSCAIIGSGTQFTYGAAFANRTFKNTAAHARRLERSDDLDADPLTYAVMGLSVFIAVVFLVVNFTRISMSRRVLDGVLGGLKREIGKLTATLRAHQQATALETAERNKLATELELINLARPLLSNQSVALSLAAIVDYSSMLHFASSSSASNDNKGQGRMLKLGAPPPVAVLDEDAVADILQKLEAESGKRPVARVLLWELPEAVAMKEVLKNPVTLEVFKDWVRDQRNDETLAMLIEIERYRRIQKKEVRERLAFAMVESYVKSDSPHQVNISEEQRHVVERGVRVASPLLFDDVAAELRKLLKTNNWRSFTGQRPSVRLLMPGCAVVPLCYGLDWIVGLFSLFAATFPLDC